MVRGMDPWSSLQASGVAADDAPPAGRPPAYVDTGLYGRTVLGFDARSELPPLCFTCGAPDPGGELAVPIRLRINVAKQLIAGATREAAASAAVGPGRYQLTLPMCPACLSRRARLGRVRFALITAPVWGLAVLLALGLMVPGSASWGVLAVLGAVGALAVARLRLATQVGLELERFDGDGFVRLVGVHHETAQAVVSSTSSSQHRTGA